MNISFGNVKTRYRNLPVEVKSTLWFVVCNVLQRGISLISTPIFTRLLTTEQYGVYSVYQSWYSIIAVFATLNLYCGVFNNGLTKYPEDRSGFTSAMQGLSTTVTLALAVVYLLGMSFWNKLFQLDTVFILLIFIELLFVPAFQFWSVGKRYEYKYQGLVAITLFISIVSPIVGIISVLCTEHKAEARVFSYVLIQVAVGIVLYIHNMRKGKAFYSKKYWSFALAFNLPLIPHYLSQIVLQQADRVMINSMVGTGEAAIYSVAYTLSTLMIIVTTAIDNSFVPFIYQHLKKEDYAPIKKVISVLLVFVGVCCLGVSLLGPELISLLASQAYFDARWIIPSVSASVYFIFLYNVFGNVEFYFECTKFTMVASCIAALLNVILNYVYIGKYGYIAAGYTTLICYIVYSVAHGIVSLKILHNNGIEHSVVNYRMCLSISLTVIALSLVITLTYNFTAIRYALIIVIVALVVRYRKKLLDVIKELKKAKED